MLRDEIKEFEDAMDEFIKVLGKRLGLHKILDALIVFLNWTNKMAKAVIKLFDSDRRTK